MRWWKWPDPAQIPILVAAALLVLAGIYAALRVSSPTDGTRLEWDAPIWQPDGVVVAPVQAEPGGLQAGDVVIAMEGQPVSSWAAALFIPSQARPTWVVGQTVRYTIRRAGQPMIVPVTLQPYPWPTVLGQHWGVLLALLLNQAIAAFVFLRRPGEWATRLLVLVWAGIGSGASAWVLGTQASDLVNGAMFWLYRVPLRGAYLLGAIAGIHLVLVWPQRQPIIRRWLMVVPLLYLAPFMLYLGLLLIAQVHAPGLLEWIGGWNPLERGIDSLILGLIAVGLGLGYHWTAPGSQLRLQLRWIVFALAVCVPLVLVLGPLPQLLAGHPLLDVNLLALLFVPLAVAMMFAILRYHLLDIDLLINRTLVYGTLTLLIGGLYALVVGGGELLLNTSNNLLMSLLVGGLIAVLFHPIRDRLQRGVNHLLYGERDDPYTVLARLGQRLEATLRPNAVLPAITETVTQALKLPYAAIALTTESGVLLAAARGQPESDLHYLPLNYQGMRVGELILASRTPGEAFSAADQRLLDALVHQIGVAVHTVQLTSELQRSRERLVLTREEERRRLRRDLHDGLGPILASVTLKLHAARAQAADPTLETRLADIQAQLQTAVGDIRRLVDALRPPALDDLGLASALREQATQYSLNGLQIRVEAPDHLPPLPAAVEVAAYRIALEALTNVVRHAYAHECHVRLMVETDLILEVSDDGVGLPAPGGLLPGGIGLASMQERAAELGGTCRITPGPEGGTQVRAWLPLPARKE